MVRCSKQRSTDVARSLLTIGKPCSPPNTSAPHFRELKCDRPCLQHTRSDTRGRRYQARRLLMLGLAIITCLHLVHSLELAGDVLIRSFASHLECTCHGSTIVWRTASIQNNTHTRNKRTTCTQCASHSLALTRLVCTQHPSACEMLTPVTPHVVHDHTCK